MRKILLIILSLSLALSCLSAFASCSESLPQEPAPAVDPTDSEPAPDPQEEYPYQFGVLNPNDPIVELTISNGDTIRLELFPWLAPQTVENFLRYVQDGFYDGVAFHRIIQGSMIQSGGFEEKDGVLSKKPTTYPSIKGEFIRNGYTHPTDDTDPWVTLFATYDLYLAHTPGVISMARTDDYDSAGSEFFICSENVPGWNSLYAAFGRVIDMESMQAVLRLEKVKTSRSPLYYGDSAYVSSDVPVERVFVTKAVVLEDFTAESTLSPALVPWFTRA